MELTVFPGEHTIFLNYTMDSEFTYGKYINHSSKHPNLRPKLFLRNGLPDILFLAQKQIQPGEQLTYNYGSQFKFVSQCVVGCKQCQVKIVQLLQFLCFYFSSIQDDIGGGQMIPEAET